MEKNYEEMIKVLKEIIETENTNTQKLIAFSERIRIQESLLDGLSNTISRINHTISALTSEIEHLKNK